MRKKLSLIGMSMLLLSVPAEAQFLKKLGKKAEQAAERTVLNRADKEVSKKTDEAIDGVLEGDGKEKEPKAKEQDGNAAKQGATLPAILGGNLDDVPDTYTFSYQVKMKIDSGKEDMDIAYWLEPKATYFGTQILNDQANQITVMDLENQGMTMFMDNGNQKMAMRVRGNQQLIDKYVKQAAAEENAGDVQLTPIGNKSILGYSCKGYRVETEDGTANVWITDEAPVGSIAGTLYSDQIPSGTMGFGANALLMEMEFLPNKKKTDRFHMICTEVKATPLTIKKAEYRSMLGGN